VKTVFTYLEIHILLSLTAGKIQGQKSTSPRPANGYGTAGRHTLMPR